ncbi:MAG TPA: hypothetical protein VF026_32780 [Ktedonobacteraceae bacterium]
MPATYWRFAIGRNLALVKPGAVKELLPGLMAKYVSCSAPGSYHCFSGTVLEHSDKGLLVQAGQDALFFLILQGTAVFSVSHSQLITIH